MGRHPERHRDRSVEIGDVGERVVWWPRARPSAVLSSRRRRCSAQRPSEHTTFCPVKGEASYFAVDGDEETADGIWSYADPISPLEAVAGYVAFYSDRFKVTQTSQ